MCCLGFYGRRPACHLSAAEQLLQRHFLSVRWPTSHRCWQTMAAAAAAAPITPHFRLLLLLLPLLLPLPLLLGHAGALLAEAVDGKELVAVHCRQRHPGPAATVVVQRTGRQQRMRCCKQRPCWHGHLQCSLCAC
jgi:hypothetical protein